LPSLDGVANTVRGTYPKSFNRHSQFVPISGPSTVAGTGMGESATAPCGYRLFTPRECARLQGFPDSFVLAASCNAQGEGSSKGGREGGCQGTRTVPGEMAQYLGIGNAVSPPVVRAIARAVLDAVLGEEDETC